MKKFILKSLICLSFFISSSYAQLQTQDTQASIYTGTYEGDRNITQSDTGDLMYKRVGAPIALKMIEIEVDLYTLEIPAGVRSPRETPKVQFIKNENKDISGLHLVYKDGKKDGPFKKIKN